MSNQVSMGWSWMSYKPVHLSGKHISHNDDYAT